MLGWLLFYKVKLISEIKHYISYTSHYCDKTLRKSNLRKGLLWLTAGRTAHHVGAHGGDLKHQVSLCHSKEAERGELALSFIPSH